MISIRNSYVNGESSRTDQEYTMDIKMNKQKEIEKKKMLVEIYNR